MKFSFYLVCFVIWEYYSKKINVPLLLPTPKSTFDAVLLSLTDTKTMTNIGVTLIRVLKGWSIAIVLGVPIGLMMGLSEKFNYMFGGILNSLRQVPMMAWVPLTIIWLGIGEGPTIFMIAINGIFQVILNTSQGASQISKDYYNAAKSMGANNVSIFVKIILPATLPFILVGARLAIGSGWMSVICAEFIATSSGLGYSMVEAQSLLQTNILIALMIISAVIGYSIDLFLQKINDKLTSWRTEQ